MTPDDYELMPEYLEQPHHSDSPSSEDDGIKMKGQIILFGTNHPLQCGDCSCLEACQFRTELKRFCDEYEIQLIAEEMSKDGLKGREKTLACEVAEALKLEHAYVDLTPKERGMLKIHGDDLACATPLGENKDGGQRLYATLTQRLSNPIRECCWYARILSLMCCSNAPSTLFICGANHIVAMGKLIKSTGMKVFIAYEDYAPNSCKVLPEE